MASSGLSCWPTSSLYRSKADKGSGHGFHHPFLWLCTLLSISEVKINSCGFRCKCAWCLLSLSYSGEELTKVTLTEYKAFQRLLRNSRDNMLMLVHSMSSLSRTLSLPKALGPPVCLFLKNLEMSSNQDKEHNCRPATKNEAVCMLQNHPFRTTLWKK